MQTCQDGVNPYDVLSVRREPELVDETISRFVNMYSYLRSEFDLYRLDILVFLDVLLGLPSVCT